MKFFNIIAGLLLILCRFTIAAEILFDDMEDISDWAKDSDCSIHLEPDYFSEWNSLKIVYLYGGGESQTWKSLSSPQDWSSQSALIFWYKFNTVDFQWDGTNYPRLLVFTPDVTGYYDYVAVPLQKTTEWRQAILYLTDFRRLGSAPDWSKVMKFELRLKANKTVSLYLDDMRLASASGTCGQIGQSYLPADINRDCYVDFSDIALLALNWLNCTDPNDMINCDPL